LSPWSTDSQAVRSVSEAAHQSHSSEAFPHRAGATTKTSLADMSADRRSSKAWRTTVPCRVAGGCSLLDKISVPRRASADVACALPVGCVDEVLSAV